jgi:AAHS family 3-hydroxyphenylpropionic acid transporter
MKPAARSLTIFYCCLAALCEGADIQIAGVAAGGLLPEFHLMPIQLGHFFSASILGLLVGALVGGRAADIVGRRTLLIGSVAVFGIFSLLTTLAWNFESLYVARLLTGIGLGGAFPAVITLVSEVSDAREKNRNIALAYAGMPLGGALVSLLSMLFGPSHWRWLFVVGGLAPLLLAFAMNHRLPESQVFLHERKSGQRGRLRTVFLGGRIYATLLLWVSFFFGLLTLQLLLNWLPTLMVASGVSKSTAAGLQIGFGLGGAIATLVTGMLLDSRLRNASILLTFIALPLLLFVFGSVPLSLATTAILVFLLGGSVLATQTFLYPLSPLCYPTGVRGAGVGAAVAAGRIGSFAGPALGGLLIGMGHGPSQLMLDLVPIAALGGMSALALALFVARTREAHLTAETNL